MRFALQRCGATRTHPFQSRWFGAERFQAIYLAATGVIAGGARPEWDEHVAFLRSEAGATYNQQLLEQFEAARKTAGRVTQGA